VSVYYVCPDVDGPSGGIRVIYRHVDVLVRNGIDAYVLHERRGFRCTWFANETPVRAWSRRAHGGDAQLPRRIARYARRGLRRAPADRPFLQLLEPASLPLTSDDVLVVPEHFGPHLAEIAPGVPKVVFNQGPSLMYRHYPLVPTGAEAPYRHRDVIGAMVASDYGRELLTYAFPGLNVERVRLAIDPALFRPDDVKQPWIAYMPRKNAADAQHVLTTLAARGALDGYEVVALDGLSDEETAARLRSSLIFLSLGYQEGFGLPAAEALACGVVVVGYHGNGGREFILPEFAYPVATADLLALATALEAALRLRADDPEAFRGRAAAGAAFVAARYSPEHESQDLLRVWNAFLGRS
jgi:Glycosyl transferases group 1